MEQVLKVCCAITTISEFENTILKSYLGAIHLAMKHDLLPVNKRYIRCAETHVLTAPSVARRSRSASSSSLQLVICMTPQMSWRLMQAKRLSIDTSFKRVHGWQEFEIESWDVAHMKCELR